jgi:hypothetical protein
MRLRKAPGRFELPWSLIHLLEGKSSTIKEGTWPFTKGTFRFKSLESRWNLLKGELFHSKKRNLIVYVSLWIDFIGMESWWHLLNENLSTIREGTWHFMKAPFRLYCQGILMAFIENKLFHDKRTNSAVYDMFPLDFMGTESWWSLLNGISSTIREETWPFIKKLREF